jgi:predicted Zn-dependent protease
VLTCAVRSFLLWSTLCLACTPKPSAAVTSPEAKAEDPIAVYDALELAIADGKDSEQQRVDALAKVERAPDDQSAGYAFVRAALNGRVAELRGANAGKLVTEAEAWARKSLERDPAYRDGAATQMLGSLYVMAPARLLEHGDSEKGLEMLEGLVAAKPDEPRYRLRLGQAYLNLGDDEAAFPHLCVATSARATLRGDEQKLLDKLVADAGGESALGCAKS